MTRQLSGKLFQLIKSLSKSEKRHFKIISSRYAGEDQHLYVALFDAIDQQSEYDEEELKKNELFNKHFSKIKERLYEAVLKSLEGYLGTDSIESIIKKSIIQAEILYKKSLYNASRKILSKAKTLCIEYEKHIHLLEILSFERRLARILLLPDLKKYFEDSFETEKSTLQKIQNVHEFEKLSAEISLLSVSIVEARSKVELEPIRKIMSDHLLKDENNALSREAKFYFNMIHATCSELEGNHEQHHLYRKRMLEIFESLPVKIEERIIPYIFTLNNYIISCHRLLKYDSSFTIALKKLKDLPDSISKVTDDIRIKVFERSFTAELDKHLAENSFEHALDLIRANESFLEKYNDRISQNYKLSLAYKTGYIYFINQKHHDTLRWLNKIVNMSAPNDGEYYLRYAKMLSILNHYELGNLDLLEYLLKSTQRYLTSTNKTYRYESVIIHYFGKKIPKNHSRGKLLETYKELREELNLLKHDNYENKSFYYLDIISWVESKINNQPLLGIIKQRVIN
jgi:hypothetical protein